VFPQKKLLVVSPELAGLCRARPTVLAGVKVSAMFKQTLNE
jgi:hypothetical protein